MLKSWQNEQERIQQRRKEELKEFEDAVSPVLSTRVRELAEKLFIAAYQLSYQIEIWNNFVEAERALDAAAEFYNRVRSE